MEDHEHPLVEQLGIGALKRVLDDLHGRTVKVKEDKHRGAIDGQDIVNLLREYERRNGTAWRA